MKNLKFVILLISLLFFKNVLFSNEINIGNKQLYFINTTITSDTNIKYLSYNNNIIMANTLHDIQFKIFSFDNDSTKTSFCKLKFINPDSTIKIVASNSNKNVLMNTNINDSIESLNDLVSYNDLKYNNLYNGIDFSLNIIQNKLKFYFDIRNIQNISNIKFKLSNLDSVIFQSDSSLSFYTKLGEFHIDKMNYLQFDTLNIDTIVKNIVYQVNGDTLSFKFINLDSNKMVQTILDKNIYKNRYLSTLLSQSRFDDYSILNCLDNYSNYYTLNLQKEFSTYKWSNYTNTFSIVKHYVYDNYFIEKYDNFMNKLYSKSIFHCYDTNKVEILKFLFTPRNSLIIAGNTKTKLNGQFKDIYDSLNYKKPFIQNYSNGFILMSNFSSDLYYANYINYDSSLCNTKLTDITNIDNKIYISGTLDSSFILSNSKYNLKYNKIGFYKTFISSYNWRDSNNKTIFISSNLPSEFLSLSNCTLQYDENKFKRIVFSGTTNSQSLLDTNLWKKNDFTNDNIVFYINESLDSIYNVIKISGNNQEGYYLNRNNYYLNKTYIKSLTDSTLFFNSISNSNLFTNESSSITKNIKSNGYYNCVNMVLNNKSKKIQKILYINSNSSQEISKAYYFNNNYYLLLNSNSNTYTQPVLKDTLITDTISTSSYLKGAFYILDENLSLTKDSLGIVSFTPYWFSFVKSNYSDVIIKDFQIVNDYLLLSGYTKSKTFYNNSTEFINGNNSIFLNDALNLKLYLGVLK